MNLLDQCQVWNEIGDYQKIIDILEEIPAEQRSPEMDSELAKAYNNRAESGEEELFEKAVELLLPHEEYFEGDHNWNFRLAYAYYYLNQEGKALHYFEQALAARPGDEDTLEFIDSCQNILDLPRYERSFRQRTIEAWQAFVEQEAELRQLLDYKEPEKYGEELIAKCDEIFNVAFTSISFEIGHNGEKYEIILTPEGDQVKLFQIVYFAEQAPTSIDENWNILVGRQANDGMGLQAFDQRISGEDVDVVVEKIEQDNNVKIGLTLYCEKLLPFLEVEEGRTYWMLETLTDQIMGEISAMSLIEYFNVVDQPLSDAFSLKELPVKLEEMGISINRDPANYLENNYSAYQISEPKEDLEWGDWRKDVIAGVTRCTPIISEYLDNETDYMDELHKDGVVAGFFYYPLYVFNEAENYSEAMLDFRDELEEAIMEKAGPTAVSFIGGASGIYYGYLDFIAWDLKMVLEAAAEVFDHSIMPEAYFHVFRQNVGSITMKDLEEK